MDKLSAIKREPCHKCGQPVFLAERFCVGDSLYHRKCLKCARCGVQLAIGSFYETESGDFCCETCPDEEIVETNHGEKNRASVADKVALFQRIDQELAKKSLCDEEKRDSLQRLAKMVQEGPDESSSEEESDDEEEVVESSFQELVDEGSPEEERNLIRQEIDQIISSAIDQVIAMHVTPQPTPRSRRSKDATLEKAEIGWKVEITDATPESKPEPGWKIDPELPKSVEKAKPERPPLPTKPPIKPKPPIEKKESYPTELNPFGEDENDEEAANNSTNPFGSDDEEEPKPTVVPKTNPFDSASEEEHVSM